MHFPALSSVALLVLSAKGTSAVPPPNGYVAFYSIFDHVGCDIQSHGLTTVEENAVGDCLNFIYPAISVSLEELKEGCSLTFYPYADCGGRPEPISKVGCFNSKAILMSARVAC
ncbi:hypothetical protein F5883DRAFT_644211 [Diaporthe sp. PMI_573]|nr:hypothetical protein F5883DRAFT_644211 [Diaporthaceae sp. PMI_573]